MAILPGFTLIGQFNDINYVSILETRFRDAEIEYVLLDEARSMLGGYMGFHRGVRVLVRDDQVEDAQLLLQ